MKRLAVAVVFLVALALFDGALAGFSWALETQLAPHGGIGTAASVERTP